MIGDPLVAAAAPSTTPAIDMSPTAAPIIVLDFGSQYSRLIARRVRECNVYCEILPHNVSWELILESGARGIILSGGPSSVYQRGAPRCAPEVFTAGIPVLGICYGLQLIAMELGGEVRPAARREYGPATLHVVDGGGIFDGLPETVDVWMSHGDEVVRLPPRFHVIGETANAPFAAIANEDGIVGIQFHPEVLHTPLGSAILRNFALELCQVSPDWTATVFIEQAVERLHDQLGDQRVICALSGGVDSSVAAALLARAVQDQVVCVFVDNGLLRQDEADQVIEVFEGLDVNLIHVDAADRFLSRLQGVIDPEEKRRRIGAQFIEVFVQQAEKLGRIDYLAQGTLYPDVIESTSHDTVGAAKIKTHHNVGGLPERLPFTLVEPLRYLFKDEVRRVGLELGLPDNMVWRQPFPGPGLAIRIIGEVTRERLSVLRRADHIVVTEIKAAGLYRELWQSFAILTPLQSVGVMGDSRTYGNVVAIRAVTSADAMTADWARLSYDLLARISTRLVNEVSEVNRVVYDITSKPPGTIEWE